MPTGMDIGLNDVPAPLRPLLCEAWAEFCSLAGALAFPDGETELRFRDSVATVWAVSAFALRHCRSKPQDLKELVEQGRLFGNYGQGAYLADLKLALAGISSQAALAAALRRFRNREMVRIAWRDIAGWAPLEETLADLTALAEACIASAMETVFASACEGKGAPLDLHGEPQRLVVIGMGKLGACELNFSSDVDLIFAFERDGEIAGGKGMAYGEFYTRLVRAFVKLMDEVTPDGFVFRVDTRLRPFGDSGPLVLSFDAMERYYQTQAREWERYAMIKSRVVAGDLEAGATLEKAVLRPFVYRRYLDFRAFGELRELKQKISIEVRRKDRADNVKLGPGGIREIEFIGQAFQLIRGGQIPVLRERGILAVLGHLGELGQLPLAVVEKLRSAYRFLRLVENRIQQYDDRQTHDVPTDGLQRLRLAYGMGFPDWPSFKSRLDFVRKGVHEVFEQVVAAPHAAGAEAYAVQDWLDGDLESIFGEIGGLAADQRHKLIPEVEKFRSSPAIRRLTTRGRAELNRLMPLLMGAVSGTEDPVQTYSRLSSLIEAIASRNVYLTLLVENPLALSQLVKLAAASAWIVRYIARHPLLLDELLDNAQLYAPLTREQLRKELSVKLRAVDGGDVEQLMTALRQFKQANVLRIAAADIMGIISIMVVSDYLSFLAEVLVGEVLTQAWRWVTEKHGVPPGMSAAEVQGFGIIAYGKLGGIELSYASDLDLVFLHGGVEDSVMTSGPSAVPAAQFYARIAKRMITILSTQLLSGALYEIDLRLRPSGNSGLLVSSLEAYRKYQMDKAWTWEQQALVRARFIAGDAGIAPQFAKIREDSLARARDLPDLRREVRDMREKMYESLAVKTEGLFDLKQGRGGIADIEFIVQFGVLSEAQDHPQGFGWTDVVRLLATLKGVGFLREGQAELLKRAYCAFRERTHRAALLEEPALVPDSEFMELRSEVQAIWKELMDTID
jgi:[glutamine synthetase] adenylyltransferase / [glutamine synthetase]-adenylyl-L-tyrosine phosphorylase